MSDTATPKQDLGTTQCPFCFYTSNDTFTGVCPKCARDTSIIIGCLRFGTPETLTGEDAEAAYRLQRIFAGLEDAPPRAGN